MTALRDAGHDRDRRPDRARAGRPQRARGRWTFQIVEDYDDTYWSLFRELEQAARDELAGGVRHLYEARLKQDERTAGARHHEASPRSLDTAE